MKTSKYRIIGLQPPGIFAHPKHGKINLDQADLKTLDALHEEGCPYLEKVSKIQDPAPQQTKTKK